MFNFNLSRESAFVKKIKKIARRRSEGTSRLRPRSNERDCAARAGEKKLPYLGANLAPKH